MELMVKELSKLVDLSPEEYRDTSLIPRPPITFSQEPLTIKFLCLLVVAFFAAMLIFKFEIVQRVASMPVFWVAIAISSIASIVNFRRKR